MYYGNAGLGADEMEWMPSEQPDKPSLTQLLNDPKATSDRPGSSDAWSPTVSQAMMDSSEWGKIAQATGTTVQDVMQKYSQMQLAKQAIKNQGALSKSANKIAAQQALLDAQRGRTGASSSMTPWIVGGIVVALLVAVGAVSLKKLS